jgi:hypothetical protein
MQKRLEGAGVEPGLIQHCDVAADDTAYRPITLTPGELDASATDVTVLMDLPDDRPEVSNVTLDSHVALWRVLQAGALQAADRCGDDDIAGELVDEAQRASGTTLHEASVRDHFVALLKTRILPVAIARATVHALSAEGYRVAAWGAHWPRLYAEAEIGRGAIPVADELNRIFNATSVVAFPEPSPWAAQTALDALAAGSAAILRGSAEAFFHEQPGLMSLGPHLRFYRTRQELLKIVRLLRSHADRQPDRAEAARSAVLAEHTIAHRLRTIAARVRQRPPSPARVD